MCRPSAAGRDHRGQCRRADGLGDCAPAADVGGGVLVGGTFAVLHFADGPDERRGTWVYYWPRPENLGRLSGLLDAPGLATGS